MKRAAIITFCVTALLGGLLALLWTWLRAPSCGLHPRYGMSFLKYAADKSPPLLAVVLLSTVAVYVIRRIRGR